MKKPGWNSTQHDLDEYKPTAQELLEKKLRLMSKEQLMRLAGIAPPTADAQQPAASQQSSREALAGSGDVHDKENARPEATATAAHPPKPAKPTSATTAHSAILSALSASSTSAGRVSVQPVVTAAPIVTNGAADTTNAAAVPAQPAHTALVGYRSVLRAAALLSPVLERSIEVELDAEAHADTPTQPLNSVEQQQQADEAETQQLIARIDTLTATATSSPRPLAAASLPLDRTPDKRAQLIMQDVAARMQQLADTPPQLPTFTPPSLPPLTPPQLDLLANAAVLPVVAAATAPSTPSIHHRLFLLLKQVASHLESLSSRQSTDAAERASLVRQLEAKDREVVQLQGKVHALEGGLMLVQKQLLAMQRGYDEQLASMMNALTRLEQRRAPAATGDRDETVQLPAQADSDGKKGTFAVPPPFVSSQPRATDQPFQQLVSPSSRRPSAARRAAAMLTPPRSPFISSPMRPASSASFLASPSPPRAGRSPHRIIARWDEVSNLEDRLQAAAAANTSQPYQPSTSAASRREMTAEMAEEEAREGGDEQVMPDLSSSTSSTFSAVLAPSLLETAKRSGRRSAGWPQHTAGWTVHMR